MSDQVEVPSGPFESEPVDLGWALSEGFSPGVAGDEVVRRCERWLVDVLDGAEVALGSCDAEIAALLAADGWSVVQVVGGWVRRAARGRAAVEVRPRRELVAPGVTRVR